MYVFVCMRVCVYVCSSQSFCTRASEDFCILSLARITKENKHCLYYSNEYGLGNKLYNFPLTHTHRMPRVAQGNLWHLTLLAPNTAVLHCCLTPDLWKLITATSLTTSLVAAPANRAPPSTTKSAKHSGRHHHFNQLQRLIQRHISGSAEAFCPCTVHTDYIEPSSLLCAPIHWHWQPAPFNQIRDLGAT